MQLEKDNDYARGAYYTKLILLGNLGYLKHWARSALNPRRLPSTLMEASGSLAYLGLLARRRILGPAGSG
jgi:hypothetical protein